MSSIWLDCSSELARSTRCHALLLLQNANLYLAHLSYCTNAEVSYTSNSVKLLAPTTDGLGCCPRRAQLHAAHGATCLDSQARVARQVSSREARKEDDMQAAAAWSSHNQLRFSVNKSAPARPQTLSSR